MGHTYTNLLYHVVFSTKERRALLPEPVRPRLYEYMAALARSEFGRALMIGGTENHLHGLISVKASVALADAMCKWKSLSSGWARDALNLAHPLRWQTGYAAFTVSESMKARVIEYIRGQAEHHRKQTFQEEFLRLLDAHEIDYDPDEIWD